MTTYDDLKREFTETFKDTRGGVELTYITGEQCVSRLNDVLGPAGWSFRILKDGIHPEADEAWCLGELEADIDGTRIVRQQYGSQKLKRRRSDNQVLDIGFDLKGAATDALKKCASLIGVGLYLSKKEGGVAATGHEEPARAAASTSQATSGQEAYACEVCGKEVTTTRFKDGTIWTPAQTVGYSRRKHGRALCMEHYRAANEARKSALLSA
jgi:hypothetical protein